MTLLIAMLREQAPPPPHHTGHTYREIERNSRLHIVFPVLIPHFPVLKHAQPLCMENRVVTKHMDEIAASKLTVEKDQYKTCKNRFFKSQNVRYYVRYAPVLNIPS